MQITGFETGVVSIPREEGPLGGGPGSVAADFVTLKMRNKSSRPKRTS